VLAVHNGRTALDESNVACFATVRYRKTHSVVMIGAKKALAHSDRAAADFARSETRDEVGGGGGRAGGGGGGDGNADFRSTENKTGGGV
jgi:hypothetical protein